MLATKAAPELGHHIYIYSNLRTKQVIYSLKPTLLNHTALKQLTFVGKGSVPEVLRKDQWKPMATVAISSPQLGLDAFAKLRQFRMVHEHSWAEGLNPLRLPAKSKRRNMLMDQRANTVADLAAVFKIHARKRTEDMATLLAYRNAIRNELKILSKMNQDGTRGAKAEELAQLEAELKKKRAAGETCTALAKDVKSRKRLLQCMAIGDKFRTTYDSVILEQVPKREEVEAVERAQRALAEAEANLEAVQAKAREAKEVTKEATAGTVAPQEPSENEEAVANKIEEKTEDSAQTATTSDVEATPASVPEKPQHVGLGVLEAFKAVKKAKKEWKAAQAIFGDRISETRKAYTKALPKLLEYSVPLKELHRKAKLAKAPVPGKVEITWSNIEDRTYAQGWPKHVSHATMGPTRHRAITMTKPLEYKSKAPDRSSALRVRLLKPVPVKAPKQPPKAEADGENKTGLLGGIRRLFSG